MPPTRVTEMPGAYAVAGRILCNRTLLSLLTNGWEPCVSMAGLGTTAVRQVTIRNSRPGSAYPDSVQPKPQQNTK